MINTELNYRKDKSKYREYDFIKVDITSHYKIGIIEFNRPSVHNALSLLLMAELDKVIDIMENDDDVRVVIIKGNNNAFSTGADLKEVMEKDAIELLLIDQFKIWDRLTRFKKPIIAAVSGWCVGGGCEMAMLCDLIVASDTSMFGQPEIKRGIGSGAGGTQRLPRAVGKAKAMEMILTGEFIDAHTAMDIGLINKVASVDRYMEIALEYAKKIRKLPPLAVRSAKESTLNAFNSTLNEGLKFERKNYYLLFASDDQKEGTQAFLEKRKPNYKGK